MSLLRFPCSLRNPTANTPDSSQCLSIYCLAPQHIFRPRAHRAPPLPYPPLVKNFATFKTSFLYLHLTPPTPSVSTETIVLSFCPKGEELTGIYFFPFPEGTFDSASPLFSAEEKGPGPPPPKLFRQILISFLNQTDSAVADIFH